MTAINYLPTFLTDVAQRLEHYAAITKMPNCNDCGKRKCKYKPEWGKPVRYNCPLWKERKY